MNKMFSFFYVKILFIVYFVHIDFYEVYAGDLSKQEAKFNMLIKALHSMYIDAFKNEKTYIARRFFTRDGKSHYTLHVQKLKEVDGVKTHNLIIEGRSQQDPFIYINNPVEARIPNPFLSIDQFKNAMYERVEKQKKEFDVNRNLIFNANKRFKAFKQSENYTDQIFDVKKQIKQEMNVSNTIISHFEVATTKTTVKLMKTKEKHKENKIRAQKVILSRATKSTTKPHLMTTTTLPKTTVYEQNPTETTVDEKITTVKVVGEEITTETMADEETTTRKTVEVETTAETTAEETHNEPDTTTEATVKTTRTKQARPYVFMGGI